MPDEIKVNHDKTAAVNQSVFWLSVAEFQPPFGVRLQLINEQHNIPTYSIYRAGDGFTHWQGVPKWSKK